MNVELNYLFVLTISVLIEKSTKKLKDVIKIK